MKKILFVFALFLLPLIAEAGSYRLLATEMAYKIKSDGEWEEWSDWQECSIKVIVDLDDDFIKIFTEDVITIEVRKWKDTDDDGKGGKIIPAYCVDNDGDELDMRFRVAKDDTFQLYLDYDSFKVVYNLEMMDSTDQ